MVRGIIIPAEAEESVTETVVSTLEDYQAIVGGWIEPVDVPTLGVTIYVHEEGLMLNLPFNSRATFLWWYFVPEARQHAMLVGPALIVGMPNRKGDSTDVPDAVVELLTTPRSWRVVARLVDDRQWYQEGVTYDDYFDALVWAMVTLERWTAAEDVRVLPVVDGTESLPPAPPRDRSERKPPAG
jgi:hypothetical protein